MKATYLPLAAAKPVVLKVLPPQAIRTLRNSYYWYLRYRIRCPKLVGPIARRLGFRVQAGPFSGMLYPEEVVRADIDSPFLPKLLGSYELECHSFVEEICSQTYDRVINIGAGEGYYAVGLARRLPGAKVIAFESHAKSRQLCAVLAQLNGVEERVEVRGVCDRQSLAAILEGQPQKRTILICDCEGAEMDLLQPDQIPSLADVDLFVELHDFVNPEISRSISHRFAATHRLEMVRDCERDPDIYPAILDLDTEDREFLISEHRLHRIDWLFGRAHSHQ
jgi:hypothetical protein